MSFYLVYEFLFCFPISSLLKWRIPLVFVLVFVLSHESNTRVSRPGRPTAVDGLATTGREWAVYESVCFLACPTATAAVSRMTSLTTGERVDCVTLHTRGWGSVYLNTLWDWVMLLSQSHYEHNAYDFVGAIIKS